MRDILKNKNRLWIYLAIGLVIVLVLHFVPVSTKSGYGEISYTAVCDRSLEVIEVKNRILLFQSNVPDDFVEYSKYIEGIGATCYGHFEVKNYIL